MADFELARAMVALERQYATGVLEVRADDKSTRIDWALGHPIFATESTLGEPLGRLLVRQGLLTVVRYEEAIASMMRRIGAEQDIRFGEIVVELGFLTRKQVDTALLDQIRWRIVRSLQLDDPMWKFTPSPDGPEVRASYPFALEPLILLATAWVDPVRLDRFLATQPTIPPTLTQTRALVTARFRLAEHEEAFLRLIDGTRSLKALIDESRDQLDASGLVTALLLADGCTIGSPVAACAPPRVSVPTPIDAIRPAGAPPRVSVPTPIDVIRPAGAPPRVSVPTPIDAIRPAGAPPRMSVPTPLNAITPGQPQAKRHPSTQILAQRLAPSGPLRRPTPMVGTVQVQGIPSAAGAGPASSGPATVPKVSVSADWQDPRRPAVLSSSGPESTKDAKLRAEQAFQLGKKLLHADDLERSLVEFRRAASLLDASVEYRLYAHWIVWLQGTKTPEQVGILQHTARAAVVEDPNLAFPRYVLGRLAMDAGDVLKAKPLFQFAAKLDPKLLDAQRYLQLISRRGG